MKARRGACTLALLALATVEGCKCTPSNPSASIPITPWPKSDRLFCVDLDGSGIELVAGADGNDLWIADPDKGGVHLRYRGTASSPVELVAAGDYGHGRRLYVARGPSGRDHALPLTLDEIDPATGATKELFQKELVRPEAVELAVADVDRDKKPDLAFAFYAAKAAVATHHMTASGGVVEGPLERTAEARAFFDLDGDGIDDAIVGQLYADGSGPVAGGLRVDLGKGPIQIPTQGGVRVVALAKDPEGHAVLDFADGWSSNYVKEGKASLKRARWNGTTFDVELIGVSPEEYTLYSIAPGNGPDGFAIVASGNQRATLFEGPWKSPPGGLPSAVKITRLDAPGHGTAAACRDARGRLRVFVPGDPTHELALPASSATAPH